MKRRAVSLAECLCPALLHRFRQRIYVRALPPEYRALPATRFVMKDRNAGFFSLFFQALGAIDFCRLKGHDLMLDFTTAPYVDAARETNWWKYYFPLNEFRFSVTTPVTTREIASLEEQHGFAEYGKNLPRKIAHTLLSEAGIMPHAHIRDAVSHEADRLFAGRRVIGVHYRGTDKANEARRVPYDFVARALSGYEGAFFFVATDEEAFLQYLSQRFPGRVLSRDAVRSSGDLPVHLDSQNTARYQLGEDALADCLLLSRCSLLFRTESNLSLACSFFNPALRVVELTDRYVQSCNGRFTGMMR